MVKKSGINGRRRETRRILLLLFTAAIIFPLTAESRTTVEMSLLSSLNRLNETEWGLTGAGEGSVTFEAENNKNVKGQLTIKAAIGDTALFDISRAYVKTRFPGFRMTFGKAPVSWGEGFAFNAGDVIFNDFNPASNLRASEIRDNAAWYTSLYIPLGFFSFIEGIFLPPPLNLAELMLNPAAAAPSIEDLRTGGRIYLKAGGIKIESGYLYRGTDITHNPYLSFQWNLLVDWHLSGSVSIPGVDSDGEYIAESIKISWGLFHLQPLTGDASISFRLEGLIQPGRSWEESDSPDVEYGILLYPEVSWTPISTINLSLRSIFSPVDLSALTMTGADWNVHQGFHILGYVSLQIGEKTDRYGFEKEGGISFTAGCRYIF